MVPCQAKKLRTVFKKWLSPAPSAEKIFTLPSCSLPSQYRSLLPARDAKAEELMRLERSSRKISNIVVGLTALIVVFIVAIVSVVIVTLFQYGSGTQDNLPTDLSKESDFLADHVTTVELSQMTNVKSLPYQVQPTGSECVKRCWEFSAFKFSAICDNGQCRCRNKAYQEESCLPIFGKCAIQHVLPGQGYKSLRVTYNGQAEPVYACKLQTPKPGLSSASTFPKDSNAGNPVRSETRHSIEIKTLDQHKNLSSRSGENETRSSVDDGKADDISPPSDSFRSPTVLSKTETEATPAKLPPQLPEADGVWLETASVEFPSTRHMTEKNTQDSSQEFESTPAPQQTTQTTDSLSLQLRNSLIQSAIAPPDQSSPESNPPSSSASPSAESSRAHVISVQGARSSRHAVTNVTISSNRRQSIVLVLVSYGGRHWNLIVDNTINVHEILMVSNHRVSTSSVSFSKRGKQDLTGVNTRDGPILSPSPLSDSINQSEPPIFTRKLLRTGYGDDRLRGNTPQLLESITGIVGEIYSFIGSARADSITYNVDFDLT